MRVHASPVQLLICHRDTENTENCKCLAVPGALGASVAILLLSFDSVLSALTDAVGETANHVPPSTGNSEASLRASVASTAR